jgi:hypothetical protein
MKSTRRRSRLLSRLLLAAAATLFFVFAAQAQTDAPLPPVGGDGGYPFNARCPQGQFLTGFDLRTGDFVDAIRPLCVTAKGPAEPGPIEPYPSMFGGTGGGPRQLVCPRDIPIVTGMYVGVEGKQILSVISIRLFCGVAAATQKLSKLPAAGFDGDSGKRGLLEFVGFDEDTQFCTGGLVAVGINGRSGKWLDAVGLICGKPVLTPRAAPPPEVTPVPAVKPPHRDRTGAPPAPPRPVCDIAREARARNSPAAPGLEESCRANLAARGAAIAQVDPVVAQARAAETDAQYQQGFDIATGIFGDPALGAQGNTATGPGSLGIRDSLSAAGQRGFNDAVKLHLSRKYERTSATLTASPNPVMVPTGQTSGATTISWKVPQGYTYCEIYLSVDNGQWSEFARGGDGTKPTTIKLGSSHTFRMMIYEGQAGTPKIVTALAVTAPKN